MSNTTHESTNTAASAEPNINEAPDSTVNSSNGHVVVHPELHPDAAHLPAPRGSRHPVLMKVLLILVLVGGFLGFIAAIGPARAEAYFGQAVKTLYHFVVGPEHKTPPPLAEPAPPKKFGGFVTVTKIERETIGLGLVPIEAQTKPILLEIPGTTDYDQNTLAKVRPLFDARVTRVFASTGQMVKKGEPLVELYSTTLAAAKADFRSKYAQWDHDAKFVESRRPLHESNQISNVVWVDSVLAEQTSRVNYLAARDKLITYGIAKDEIDKLIAHISSEKAPVNATEQDVQDISHLVVTAPIDGMIVERDVVSGNFYDDMAVLMVISPMEKLWVWGNVYEKDQGEVHIGQTWQIQFPYLDLKLKGKVEHIDARVDPGSRTLKIRAAIDNPGRDPKSNLPSLKAAQLVKAVLEILPVPGQTVIPRNAMVVLNGENCCFIKTSKDGEEPMKFERRMIDIDQENHDFVVVKGGDRGLVPGQKVATNGSLILSQIYEDESTVDSGTPMQ